MLSRNFTPHIELSRTVVYYRITKLLTEKTGEGVHQLFHPLYNYLYLTNYKMIRNKQKGKKKRKRKSILHLSLSELQTVV